MRVGMAYGQHHIDFEIAEPDLLAPPHPVPDHLLADPGRAVRDVLEAPFDFPPLRRALTPDDHVAIVLDEHVPQLAAVLTPVLEQLRQARVEPGAVTIVCAPPADDQPWLADLPDEFGSVRIEVHDPAERKRLSYLATTQRGRRIYLNRSVIDADQVVILGRRNYDALTGYGGAAAALFPALSDEATQKQAQKQLSLRPPSAGQWPLEREAEEVAWLLGAPFLVQVIEGPDNTVARVVGGTLSSSAEGRRLLDACWRMEFANRVDLVIASLGGAPARQHFANLAQALANAARVVKPGGRIVLLTDADPALGPAAEFLRRVGDSHKALGRLEDEYFADQQSAFLWASAAQQATIYLLSRLTEEQTEDLYAVPLEDAGQAQRLVEHGRSCVFLPDADKMMAHVRGDHAAKGAE